MTFIDNRPKKKWYKKLINWFKNNYDLIIPSILISFSNLLSSVVICKIFMWFSIDPIEHAMTAFIVWLLIGGILSYALIIKLIKNE